MIFSVIQSNGIFRKQKWKNKGILGTFHGLLNICFKIHGHKNFNSVSYDIM